MKVERVRLTCVFHQSNYQLTLKETVKIDPIDFDKQQRGTAWKMQ